MYEDNIAMISLDTSNIKTKGQIMKFDGDFAIIICDDEIDFPLDSIVDFIIYDQKQNEKLYSAKIRDCKMYRVVLKDIKRKQNVTRIERRLENRAVVNLIIYIKNLHSSGNIILYDSPIKALAVNLSANGILIHSKKDFPQDSVLGLTLPIKDEEIICAAKIVRKNTVDNKFEYGCSLLMLTEQNKEVIRSFVKNKN